MTERYPGARDPRRTGQARLPLYAAPLHVVLDRLVSSEQGLPEDEAARRLEMLGPNRLSAARLKPVSAILAGQLRSVAVLLLLTAVALALITGRTLEAAVVGLVLVVNVLLGLRAELKGRRFIDILLRNRQEEAVVLRDGGSVRIDASRLVPGDVIDVVAGQRVPADARLIRATGVRAEEEFLTGSAKPVEKAVDPPPSAGTPLQGRRSMLFFGSTLSQGRARAVVTATGTSTAASRLGRASRALERRMTPLESRIEGVGRRMGWMALGWAGVVLVVGLIRDQELTRLLEAGIALCLAAVPEALPIVTALALTIAIHRMARRRVVVRRSGAIEGLGTATVVCADVVGTLTSGPPRATRIVTPSAVATAVESGTEERPELEMVPAAPEAKAEVDGLLRAVALTLERAPGTDGTDRDLTNRALWDLVRIAGMDPWHLLRSAPVVAVVPPDPDHPMSATFRRGETGSSAFVRGDVDAVLARCRSTSGPRGPRNLDAEGRSRILADSRTLAAEGYRVIAFALHPNAARTADLRDPLTYLGMIGLENAPATDVATTFADLEKAGVTTVLFSDDEGITGQAVARRAGVAVKDHEVLEVTEATGPEPFRMNGAGPARRLFARLGPGGRQRVLGGLRGRDGVVVTLGTGKETDLESADVTLAASPQSTEPDGSTADVVLEYGGFADLILAVRQGRSAFHNLRRSVHYLFGCSLAELLLLGATTLLGWPLPLLPLQILWLNLVTVVFPSLALAVEPEAPDVMTGPAGGTRAGIVTRRDIVSFSGSAVLMASAAVAAFVLALEVRPLGHAVTVAFTTLALAQLFQLGNVRPRTSSDRAAHSAPNPWALAAVGAGVVLQLVAVYWGPVSEVLGTVPLGVTDWATALGLAAVASLVGRIARVGSMTLPLERSSPPASTAVSTVRAPEPAAQRNVVLFQDTSVARTPAAGPTRIGGDDPWDRARAAVEAGDLHHLGTLVERHPKIVRARDDEGTLLHHATGMPTLSCPPRAPEMVSLLVEAGADPDAGERLDGSGETPLIHAVSVNNVPVARRLLELGADPERHGRYPEQGIDTALGYALFYGQDPWFGMERGDCIELLLSWGAATSLPLTAALGRRSSVAELLPTASREDRLRALVFAAHRGEAEVVQTCLDAGVEASRLTSFFHERLTPLLAAAGQGHLDTVQVLLDAGVEAEWPDDGLGTTAMVWAWTRSTSAGRTPTRR